MAVARERFARLEEARWHYAQRLGLRALLAWKAEAAVACLDARQERAAFQHRVQVLKVGTVGVTSFS